MVCAYVSGPYRPRGQWRNLPVIRIGFTLWNIYKARQVAIRYWRKGIAAWCPHQNSALFDGKCPDKVWLKGDIAFIRRLRPHVDYIVMMKGWEQSEGARQELKAAQRRGISVLYDEG